MQGRVLLGLSASSQRPGSGQVTRRCCSPPPQASEHWKVGWTGRQVRAWPGPEDTPPHPIPGPPDLTSLQEEMYQLRQGCTPQGRRAGGIAGPGWQWKGRSGRRSCVSTHCTSRIEDPPPQLREHCRPGSSVSRPHACTRVHGSVRGGRAGCGQPPTPARESQPASGCRCGARAATAGDRTTGRCKGSGGNNEIPGGGVQRKGQGQQRRGSR